MAAYSIGEVEQLTGVKPYVLRYWEEVIPCFAPKKDIGGRRVYTQREVDIILRLKYLVYEKRYTIDGARTQIIQEAAAADNHAEALQAIHELREQLSGIYLMVRKFNNNVPSQETVTQQNVAEQESTPSTQPAAPSSTQQ